MLVIFHLRITYRLLKSNACYSQETTGATGNISFPIRNCIKDVALLDDEIHDQFTRILGQDWHVTTELEFYRNNTWKDVPHTWIIPRTFLPADYICIRVKGVTEKMMGQAWINVQPGFAFTAPDRELTPSPTPRAPEKHGITHGSHEAAVNRLKRPCTPTEHQRQPSPNMRRSDIG